MAKVYRAPIEPPTIDYVTGNVESWRQQEESYIEKLSRKARLNGNSELLGETIRFQRGDGYAVYMVWRTRPLELIWIEIGDCWQVEDALIRGLRISDVREKVDHEKKMRELFGGN